MPEVICNTSPLQYLHQLGLLDLLPGLVGKITIPPTVVEELEAGLALGLDLPDVSSLDWIMVRSPEQSGQGELFANLGRGETEVLLLALQTPAELVLILDDRTAREAAAQCGLKFTGTLGVLLDAKRAGLISAVAPQLDRPDSLGFHLARHTWEAILRLAGETS